MKIQRITWYVGNEKIAMLGWRYVYDHDGD